MRKCGLMVEKTLDKEKQYNNLELRLGRDGWALSDPGRMSKQVEQEKAATVALLGIGAIGYIAEVAVSTIFLPNTLSYKVLEYGVAVPVIFSGLAARVGVGAHRAMKWLRANPDGKAYSLNGE